MTLVFSSDAPLARDLASALSGLRPSGAVTPISAGSLRNLASHTSRASSGVFLLLAGKPLDASDLLFLHAAFLGGLRDLTVVIHGSDTPDATALNSFKDAARTMSMRPIFLDACDPIAAVETISGRLDELALAARRRHDYPLRFEVTANNLSGTVLSGELHPGQHVRLQPAGESSILESAEIPAGAHAVPPTGATLRLTRPPAAIPRMISAADAPAELADQFEATLAWFDDQPMVPGRTYLLHINGTTTPASVTTLKHEINPATQAHTAARRLGADRIGVCNLATESPIVFDPCTANPWTARFELRDLRDHRPVGAGIIHFALRRSHNIHVQHVDITKAARAERKGQKPCVLWFTGLSGSGKSTIANKLEQRLFELGCHTYLLDGDNVRHRLNKDLGFTTEDRVENIRRVAEVARLMTDAGLIVLTAFISPFRSERLMARRVVGDGEFLEIFVDTPLAVAEQRDPKGLYKKARRGELKNFTGIDSPYENPEAPEIHLRTVGANVDELAARILKVLADLGFVPEGKD